MNASSVCVPRRGRRGAFSTSISRSASPGFSRIVAQQHQAHARIRVARHRQQRLMQVGIAAEPLGAADQPQVQLVFERPEIARSVRSGIPRDRPPGTPDAP